MRDVDDSTQKNGLPRVNHVNAVLESDSDDVILGEIGANGCETFADLIGLVGLRIERNVTLDDVLRPLLEKCVHAF